jgi:hypothetical protein
LPVRIFETDPDSKPRKRQKFDDDFAFRFRSGMSVLNPKTKKMEPTSLAEWRVTSGDPEVAASIAQLYGGQAQEWQTSKDDYLEVLTSRQTIEIVIDGSDAITDKFILWGRSGPIHECDGVDFLSPDDLAGTPCGCPPLLADRKAHARSGRGPSPHTRVVFRLADDYDLGVGSFQSTSFDLLMVLHEVRNDLDAIGEPALCELTLELVEYDTKAGRHVEYRKPVITVLKAYADAIADDPFSK